MKKEKETFAKLFASLAYRYDLRPVFDDFLTLTLCAFSQNPAMGKSHDEDLYLETVAKYKKEDAKDLFPKLLALLIVEMEERIGSSTGNDVLGEYYELNFCRKGTGQFFTPPHVCDMMAQMTCGAAIEGERLSVLDPCCGSGRMLLSGSKVLGTRHNYYGIDIDHTCVKMTVINLFLNGNFHGEVMCSDALRRDDFRVSYRLSFLPFGIFRIQDKEQSSLWHKYRVSLPQKKQVPPVQIILPSQEGGTTELGSQLQLF